MSIGTNERVKRILAEMFALFGVTMLVAASLAYCSVP
jgi:hypothetical protein